MPTPYTDPDGYNVPANSIVFDYKGNVKKLPSTNPAIPGRFVVSVSTVKGAAKQCAIVETIIGGMRTAQGNAPGTGCP
jgi:hypothetical protein